MPERLQAIIFDFDETLADTLPGRIVTMQDAAHQVLDRDLSPRQALEVIQGGSNLESMMASLSDGNVQKAEELLVTFRGGYYRHDRPPLTLFPGMEDVLAQLQISDVRLAIVTSRYRAGADGEPTHGVLWELQRMGLEGLFEVIVGYEDSANHKPAPDPFLICLERLGLAGGDAIAIGDLPSDIVGARAAGIRGAAGVWGANDPDALLATRPDEILSSPSAILSLLD